MLNEISFLVSHEGEREKEKERKEKRERRWKGED